METRKLIEDKRRDPMIKREIEYTETLKGRAYGAIRKSTIFLYTLSYLSNFQLL